MAIPERNLNTTLTPNQKAINLIRTVGIAPLGALMAGLAMPAVAAESTTEQTLSTVTVQADADNEVQPDGYLATTTRVGKTLQDPQDVPQAVTTVTKKIMEEQQVNSLREALRNVSGLTFNAAEGGRSGDNMMLRGFYTFGDMYLDGIRDTAQYNRETFAYEQVDVLRGAAAMLFGRGQAGGVINQVSKSPVLTDKYRIAGSVGSNGYQQEAADLNKVIGEHAAIRVNLMNRDEGSWRSNPATGAEPEIHRNGVAVAAQWGIGTDNSFKVSHYYLNTQDNPDYGVPFDSTTHAPSTKYSASTFWGIDKNFDDSRTNMTTLTHEYKFSPKTQLRTQVRASEYLRAYWASAPSNTTDPNANGTSPKTRKMDTDDVTVQSDLSTQFISLGMKHEALVGVEYLKENSSRWSLKNIGSSTTPIYSADVVNGAPSTYAGNSYAIYVQDTMEFIPHWKATLGVRRDMMSADYGLTTGNPPVSAGTAHLDFAEPSYRTALSYQPNSDAHYYVGWSDSFSPTADLYQTSAGTAYPPERSQVLEAGAKWLFFNGDLAFRTAIYRADKEWERNADLESTAGVLTKKRRTDGIEFELAGRITKKWEAFAGIALMDAKILEVAENTNATTGVVTYANPNYQGQTPPNTPPYTANLWTTYALGDGWKVGGGFEAKGKRYGYNPSSSGTSAFNPNTISGYVRWDAMVAYEQKKYTIRLNIQNLFNTVYYDSLYVNGGFTTPGTNRKFLLMGEYKF
ncbi:TonB-dependent receptor [Sulfuriferula nivalis]|uniref:Ligand-gated channel protein n=1 Tax=Sulfuriferula nivalis TaxID=2675298 RepID=A0A809SA22_9PROT|nr:TonB-dependent siderophore receptor [Sulfuriferula nivalis]BBP01302.1 ligand-gated channel protein [Sulfuriferula nivalis]